MKITIFGLAGTGKTTTGKIIAEKLGYEYMSTGNIYREMAKNLGLTLNEFQLLAEKDEKYDRELDEVKVTEYGKNNDNFVLESRLAWHFVPDSIKIRLYCEANIRIQRVANRENKPFDQVEDETSLREESIYKTYKNLYGLADISSPANFDLNIDTTHIGIDEVVNAVLEFVKGK